jgi:hypothetical protein
MDVIGFLFVSLSSSAVHLHGSLGSGCARACSEAGFSSQNGSMLVHALPHTRVCVHGLVLN